MLFDVRAALSEILADTPATPATIATNTPKTPPLSRVSQVSQGEGLAKLKIAQASTLPPRASIIRALRSGLKTPGAVATATMLGATDTYQELDRMAIVGLVSMASDGALSLTPSADLEAAP